MKTPTATELALRIVAIYATIEGNKMKNAYEIGKLLMKASRNPSKAYYKDVEKELGKSNKVEKTTIAKYRKFFNSIDPLQHLNNHLLDLLKAVSSFSVIETLCSLGKVTLPALLEVVIDQETKVETLKYGTFIETLTVSMADNFVLLIKKYEIPLDEAIATLPQFNEYVEKIEAMTEREEETEGTEEATTTEAGKPSIDFKAIIQALLGDSADVETFLTAEEVINALRNAPLTVLDTVEQDATVTA